MMEVPPLMPTSPVITVEPVFVTAELARTAKPLAVPNIGDADTGEAAIMKAVAREVAASNAEIDLGEIDIDYLLRMTGQ